MGLSRKSSGLQSRNFPRGAYFRTTPLGRRPGIQQLLASRSAHLKDLLEMCRQGMWGWQLRQFMPPASLLESIRALLDLGLIECAENKLSAG